MSVAVHRKPNCSVEFVSLLCLVQIGRFDICLKAMLADPGYVIVIVLTLDTDGFNSGCGVL